MQVVIVIFVKVFMVIITANVCCHGHDFHDFLAGHDLDYYQVELIINFHDHNLDY